LVALNYSQSQIAHTERIMIGKSRALLDTLRLIERISRCDASVVIEGETGTGKELAARAIHYGGDRHDRPFIPVNCGALPDALVENELFGHRRGAYTDASSEQNGLIARAQQGTLFLDEVDALTPKAQVALLRFLQDSQYRPLGGAEAHSADVRIIAASNADLAKLTEQGTFRQDLLYRLKIMYVKMPPLRERHGDVSILCTHFLSACAARFGNGAKSLHPETALWLDRYAWPGNVRELENLIYREYLLAESSVIRVAAPITAEPNRHNGDDRHHNGISGLDFNEAKAQVITEFEQNFLTHLLATANGNVTRAAQLAGKERRAFGKLLKKHGIDRYRYS
jgi:two-component system, NtrC family, response regulator GlrR